MSATYMRVAAYAKDAMNLPVASVEDAMPFYERVRGLKVLEPQLKANGLGRDDAGYRVDRHGDRAYRVFFVIAPDGLCYCIGQRQP